MQMTNFDPLLFRFLEKLVGLLVGGMSIYLGYRLFSSVKGQSDGKGSFKLPLNTSIVVTKVGPGVFFALFGTVTVCIALYKPLEIVRDGARVSYAGSNSAAPENRADRRALLRRDIAALNTIPAQLRPDLRSVDRDEVTSSLREVKLQLMQPVWGTSQEGFGDFSEFAYWVEKGEAGQAPAAQPGALELYRYGEVQ